MIEVGLQAAIGAHDLGIVRGGVRVEVRRAPREGTRHDDDGLDAERVGLIGGRFRQRVEGHLANDVRAHERTDHAALPLLL